MANIALRPPAFCRPPFGVQRLLSLVVLSIHLVAGFADAKASAAENKVFVLYAGSLGNLMETDVGPSFSRATGYKYVGEAKGSVLSANLIKDKLRTPDVFISADPKVNQRLMGKENGDLIRWYTTIFGNEMVLGYNPKSRFAPELRQVVANDTCLYEVLQEKGFRLGRGDPELEPKGYRTLFLFDLAEKYYQKAGLVQNILNNAEHPGTPVIDLSGRATCRTPRGWTVGCRHLLSQRSCRALLAVHRIST